ncbi:hypothetical protein HK101_002790 [Irineochytrium annulatum]|nr:hypothetical protein HK101_002790 [Irineochytrium annulatum]
MAPAQPQLRSHSTSERASSAVLRALLHHLLTSSKSFTPHTILFSLVIASRILNRTNGDRDLPGSLRDPLGLMLASAMIAEAQLADRQTSCAVWGRFMSASVGLSTASEGKGRGVVVRVDYGVDGGIGRLVGGDQGAAIACARLKRVALQWVGWDCHVTVEEYVFFLKALRGEA